MSQVTLYDLSPFLLSWHDFLQVLFFYGGRAFVAAISDDAFIYISTVLVFFRWSLIVPSLLHTLRCVPYVDHSCLESSDRPLSKCLTDTLDFAPLNNTCIVLKLKFLLLLVIALDRPLR